MSRIDRALRIREGGAGATPTDPPDAPAGDASSLHQYDREERIAVIQREVREEVQHDFQEETAAEVVEHREPTIRPARLKRHIRRTDPSADEDRRARLVTGNSSSVSVEQYRKLAAVLHDAQVESGLKSVIITSALPGEGKTLTAVNLALTLTESYERRVLLIDADLRGPSLHHALDLANERGLGDALRDGHEPHFVEAASGLSVLVAGRPGPTPLAGLTSRRMGEILEYCESRFDWVLIDTPPVGVLPDAQVLTRLVGAVLFVVGAGSTPAATVERAIAELGGPDSVFGIVMNRVDERRIPDADYYGRYMTSSK
jgi:capsular exopolysaccharide synthesis family protein